MNNIWKFLATNIRSSLVLAITISLSLVLSSAMASSQAATRIPTASGQGTITTNVSPVINASPMIETPVQHTGDTAGTITTSESPRELRRLFGLS